MDPHLQLNLSPFLFNLPPFSKKSFTDSVIIYIPAWCMYTQHTKRQASKELAQTLWPPFYLPLEDGYYYPNSARIYVRLLSAVATE